jgi:hypothetical protein
MALEELSLSHCQNALAKRKKVRCKVALSRDYEPQSGGNLLKVMSFEVAEGQDWQVS